MSIPASLPFTLYVPAQMQVWFGIHWRLRQTQSKLSTISYLVQTRHHPSLLLDATARNAYWTVLTGQQPYRLPILCTGCLQIQGHSQTGALLYGCNANNIAEFPGEALIWSFLQAEYGWTRDMLRTAWLQWYAQPTTHKANTRG
jgi:hypothetical protein